MRTFGLECRTQPDCHLLCPKSSEISRTFDRLFGILKSGADPVYVIEEEV